MPFHASSTVDPRLLHSDFPSQPDWSFSVGSSDYHPYRDFFTDVDSWNSHQDGAAFVSRRPSESDWLSSRSPTDPLTPKPTAPSPALYGATRCSYQDSGSPLTHSSLHAMHSDDESGASLILGMQATNTSIEPTFIGPDLRPIQRLPSEQAEDPLRYRVSINAATVIAHGKRDCPITYLNKSQKYLINIRDTLPVRRHSPTSVIYRTRIRVSFDSEQLRSRTSKCWQLWRDSRGYSELHQRAGKTQAVEFCGPPDYPDEGNKSNIRISSESLDGFCFVWAANHNAEPECSVGVRFRFLSTDFSLSKGVEGASLRLCAKTQVLSSDPVFSSSPPIPEISYCKVKLFRDHGAERKMQNDDKAAEKQITKAKQAIHRLKHGPQIGVKQQDVDRTKDSETATSPRSREGWSKSSATFRAIGPSEQILRGKLKRFQDQKSSKRSEGIFDLRGGPEDDPDDFPLEDAVQSAESQALEEAAGESKMGSGSILKRSTLSGTSSSLSSASTSSSSWERSECASLTRLLISAASSQPDDLVPGQMFYQPQTSSFYQSASPSVPSLHAGALDRSRSVSLPLTNHFRAPAPKTNKPVACFYARLTVSGRDQMNQCYRAIYVFERTLRSFVSSMARKCNLDPDHVEDTVRVYDNTRLIKMDDETIEQMLEGQDMIAHFGVVQKQKTADCGRGNDGGPRAERAEPRYLLQLQF